MLKGQQTRTGTVHFAEEQKLRGRTILVQLCPMGRSQHLALERVPDDMAVDCGRCVKRSASIPSNTPSEENEMTTTVKRGAGRPAAAAKTAKAAQRTPLPAKDAKPAETSTKATRGAKLAKLKASEAAAAKAADRAPSSPTTAKRAAAKATPVKATRRTRTASATLPEDFPGAKKIMRLLDGPAQEAGWAGRVVSADPQTGAVEVAISKGDVTMTWYGVDGKQDTAQAPRYSDGERTVMMKNIAGILAQATGEREWVKPIGTARKAKAKAPTGDRKAKTADTPMKSLPFDPTAASDEEIVEALRGRTLTWTNGLSKAVESAVVAATRDIVNAKGQVTGTKPAVVKVETHPTKKTRMVTFTDHEGAGTRTVALDRMLEVH